tara:strand:+ start:1789 stop:2025 length:237 start_codon:yes stop_codon:yes gene_type:complete
MMKELEELLSTFMNTLGEVQERFDTIEQHILDLEAIYDDIPQMHKLWNAVAELQDLHDAPATLLGNYLNGQLPARSGV